MRTMDQLAPTQRRPLAVLAVLLALLFAYGLPGSSMASEEPPNNGVGPKGRLRATGGDADDPRRGLMLALKRAERDFEHIDTNNDSRLSPAEWMRRGNFEDLDTDGDGFLSFQEMSFIYRPRGKPGQLASPILPSATPEIDPSYATDRVSKSAVSSTTFCAIDREACGLGFAGGTAAALKLGLIPTGLGPRFPAAATCLGIDDYYALDYSYKRKTQVFHGGFDIPAPWDTPVLAVAAGTVVGRFQGNDTQRGVEVILRHSPEDTGLPFWVYTQYAHLAALPPQGLGQRVRMGEVIGQTSNTGLDGSGGNKGNRRPALHFVAWLSPERQFADTGSAIVPVQGQWMDPHTMYRGKPPFESSKVAELPDAEKWVDIPVMFGNGATSPPNTRLIWPYACRKRQ